MPDIEFSLKDAIARLTDECNNAVERVKREYEALVTQLQQAHVAREKFNELTLQLGASAVAVTRFVVHDSYEGKAFRLANNVGSSCEQTELIRPLKKGVYRAIVIFTEDEEKTETPI